MGFYLRKSFRAGPVRFNLSKSGVGVSGGVKGARVGVGPRGQQYVHAGRHGLYYREQLSSKNGYRQSAALEAVEGQGGLGCGLLVLIVAGIGVLFWLLANPVVLFFVILISVGVLFFRWYTNYKNIKLLASYKADLDEALVLTDVASDEKIMILIEKQKALPDGKFIREKVRKLNADVYQAVLDKVLDDGFVTQDEALLISAAENVLHLDSEDILNIKKEIFSSAYIDAISDRQITKDELAKLENLVQGLKIPQDLISKEMGIVKEIYETQKLKLPFKEISKEEILVPVQKSEQAFFQGKGKVLSKRKSKESSSGYEYTLRRKGTLILTNKRLFIAGEGTTNIRFAEIEDIDVDIDEALVEITKKGSSRPIIIKCAHPVFVARAIDLLAEDYRL